MDSNTNNPFADNEVKVDENTTSKNIEQNNTSSKMNEQGLPSIGAISGPVVLFFGPASVGKTVTLMRLLHYITNNKNCSYAFDAFRDDSSFATAKTEFEDAMKNMSTMPPRTQEYNFLLLNITYKGKPVFKILEAPGEHFFSKNDPNNMGYPTYLNQIYKGDNKKVFVIFFSDDMFETLSHRDNYSNKLSQLIRQQIQPKRDRIIFLYNKVDQNPELFTGGRVNEQAVMDKIYSIPAYSKLMNTIKTHKSLKNVLFVPFYSGNFKEQNLSWSMSENHYPEKLWYAINHQLKKRWSLF